MVARRFAPQLLASSLTALVYVSCTAPMPEAKIFASEQDGATDAAGLSDATTPTDAGANGTDGNAASADTKPATQDAAGSDGGAPQKDASVAAKDTNVAPMDTNVPPKDTFVLREEDTYVPPKDTYVPPKDTYVPPECKKDQELCNGICVSIKSNKNHCGKCFNKCKKGDKCKKGKCD